MTAIAMSPRDLIGRRLGRYEVLTQLATGGMATVYVARAQGVAGFERLVAVKVLHPHLAHDDEFISMFLDEARLAARIRHPNVVPTLDISDTHGDGYFLVMEYIEGDHFGALLREASKTADYVSPQLSLRVVVDALEGLGAAHALRDGDGRPLGIVHRDISPHNILVGSDGTTRITDFGVAKAEVRMSSTRDGQFKGKLAYMSPEQASSGHADQRSDLFSMGVVLWEALVGRRLFKAENNAELLNRLLYLPIPAPSDYTESLKPLDSLMAKLLERDPERRFQSSEELIEAIEDHGRRLGGLESQRAVGRAVREFLGAKIDREAVAIREAIDALGRSALPPGPVPQPGGLVESPSVTPSSRSAVRSIEDRRETETKVERRSVPLVTPPPPTSSAGRWLLAAVLILAVGGGAYWASQREAPVQLPPLGTEPVRAANQLPPLPTPVPAPPPPAALPPVVPLPVVPAPAAVEAERVVAIEAVSVPGDEPSSPRRRRGSSAAPPSSTGDNPPRVQSPASPPPPPADDDDIIVNPY